MSKLRDKNIVTEMENSFLDYAMSVIVSRALPDVRDGLKPVHRRILYAMNELGNTADKPYKKSARIVGDVIGKYHPHGDSAVYEAMVRMAQDFSFREMLVDGHGNFGSIDGDGAAAMRYTEARMSKISMEIIKDINKDTVDFQENYDANEQEPKVLPAKFPNILVNGGSGIAVGMATNIPPHNLSEVIDGTIAYLDNKDITIDEIMQYIKGPDFPLGAQILGDLGIIKAYHTGNGGIKVRSKYDIIEEKNGKFTVIVSEIPYQVNKANLVEKIADAVKSKRVDGITDLRDESDRDGIRIVMELRRGVTPEVIVNNLFKYTQLENTYSINMLALVGGEPQVLNLKEIIHHYVEHQIEVITRKTKFELKKAQARIHILHGMQIAVNHIDEVIKLIKASSDTENAKEQLINKYDLTDIQAKAILEMKLQKLTGLEIEKLEEEIQMLLTIIEDLQAILASESKIQAIIKDQLLDIKERFGNKRRTEIVTGYVDSSIDYEDLIEESDVIITLTDGGYIKRFSTENYRVQHRGGKGVKGMNVNEADLVKHLTFGSTHSDLLLFTNQGRVYKTRVHQIPEFSKAAKGLPLVNIIDLEENETITNIITVKSYLENSSLVFITKDGIGKKTLIEEYKRVNKNGKRALNLRENDEVVAVFVATEDSNIFVASRYGKSVLFANTQLRNVGRVSTGVRIMQVQGSDDYIISADLVNDGDNVLTITTKGYGKQTPISEYRLINRGGKGVKNIKVTDKNGFVAKTKILKPENIEHTDLLLITNDGQTIRVKAQDVSFVSRVTQGVKIMNLKDKSEITNIELIDNVAEEKDE